MASQFSCEASPCTKAPFREGRAFSAADAQTLLGWVKDLGCNFVRFAHYPHNENEIRLADRMGLLVWSEIPVYWDIDWSSATALENAEAQLDMIARDHNRAAVILWSVSNETPVKPERLTFLTQLVRTARGLDPTRLVTSAMNHVDESSPEAPNLIRSARRGAGRSGVERISQRDACYGESRRMPISCNGRSL